MTRARPRAAADPDSAGAAYLLGLRWLAARELSERQVRERLERRGFSGGAVAAALERLTGTRALDDRRVALAAARTEVHVRHHGPLRVLRRLQAMGVDGDLAREAVREAFGDLDERRLMRQALARRLRSGAIPDSAHLRRLHAYLVRQGFPSPAAAALLRSRARRAGLPDDE